MPPLRPESAPIRMLGNSVDTNVLRPESALGASRCPTGARRGAMPPLPGTPAPAPASHTGRWELALMFRGVTREALPGSCSSGNRQVSTLNPSPSLSARGGGRGPAAAAADRRGPAAAALHAPGPGLPSEEGVSLRPGRCSPCLRSLGQQNLRMDIRGVGVCLTATTMCDNQPLHPGNHRSGVPHNILPNIGGWSSAQAFDQRLTSCTRDTKSATSGFML